MRSIATRVAVATLAAAALDASAGVYSDLWWNPQESGWGMSVVQQGDTALVTLYVYAPDGKPTWYVASDARVFAYDNAGQPAMHGTLYRATGPWLGGPFDPSRVVAEPVGSLTLEPRAGGRLGLTYIAEGVEVSKEVVRQTFSAPELGARYVASFSLRQALPGGPQYGLRQFAADVQVDIDQGEMLLRAEEAHFGRCDYRGPYVPSGKLARIAGTFQCDSGEAGTFEISDFEVTTHAISGFLHTQSPGNRQYGRFAAARF